MPKISSIEFARNAAGYEGDKLALGEEQYLDDLVKIIKSGGWLLAYTPEDNPPFFEYHVANDIYSQKLKSIGYAGIDDTYDITFLFTTYINGNPALEKQTEIKELTGQVQIELATILNCSKQAVFASNGRLNNLYYSIAFTKLADFMQAIEKLKLMNYLPPEACQDIAVIKAEFQPEALDFLRSRK